MIRVITTNPTGGSYDITELIDGLRWSSVNPGGDESANFVFKQPWSRNNVEIAKGSIIRIEDGLERCFTGRIEELDRGGDATEEVAVTTYGLGIRLKDNQMAEIYVDSDLSAWDGISGQDAITIRGSGFALIGHSVGYDNNGRLSLAQVATGAWSASGKPVCSSMYDARGVRLGSLRVYWIRGANVDTAASWTWFTTLHELSGAMGYDLSGDLKATGPAEDTVSASGARYFASLTFRWDGGAAGSANKQYDITWFPTVYGDHGLTERGTASENVSTGFFDSDIVSDVIGRLPGVVMRHHDEGSFVIRQASYRTPTDHESVISDVSKYESRDWGTWGSDNLLDTSDDGYFDYRFKDLSARQWSIRRAECVDLDLHSEISTLFDTVNVSYQDAAGKAATVTRTRTSPELIAAGMSPKTASLQASSALTPAGAETLGDVFLALSGAFSPARGTVQIEGTLDHNERGKLRSHFMRADGSNLQIPDILPSTTMLALDDSPDRRTTFPIKRVSHDASGSVISTTVELDQTNDVLTQLQNRLDSAAAQVLG